MKVHNALTVVLCCNTLYYVVFIAIWFSYIVFLIFLCALVAVLFDLERFGDHHDPSDSYIWYVYAKQCHLCSLHSQENGCVLCLGSLIMSGTSCVSAVSNVWHKIESKAWTSSYAEDSSRALEARLHFNSV